MISRIGELIRRKGFLAILFLVLHIAGFISSIDADCSSVAAETSSVDAALSSVTRAISSIFSPAKNRSSTMRHWRSLTAASAVSVRCTVIAQVYGRH